MKKIALFFFLPSSLFLLHFPFFSHFMQSCVAHRILILRNVTTRNQFDPSTSNSNFNFNLPVHSPSLSVGDTFTSDRGVANVDLSVSSERNLYVRGVWHFFRVVLLEYISTSYANCPITYFPPPYYPPHSFPRSPYIPHFAIFTFLFFTFILGKKYSPTYSSYSSSFSSSSSTSPSTYFIIIIPFFYKFFTSSSSFFFFFLRSHNHSPITSYHKYT